MEPRSLGPSVTDPLEGSCRPTSFNPEKNKYQEQFEIDLILHDSAVETAIDWLDATGGESMSVEEYRNLLEAGYTSVSLEDVLRIFYDWDDFVAISRTEHESRNATDDQHAELIKGIKEEIGHGLLPQELLQGFETYTVDNPKPGGKKLIRYRPTDVPPSDVEVLQRYYKHIVASELLKDRPPDKPLAPDRLISLALGFTLSTKKPLSSFSGAIKNSDSELSDTKIGKVIESMGAYEYIYPDSRKAHLARIVSIGRPKPAPKIPRAEFRYDTETARVILLGRTALSQFTHNEGREYLEFLVSKGVLLMGREAYPGEKRKAIAAKTKPLSKLLTVPHGELPETSYKPRRYMLLGEDRYLQYGKWLVSVLEPSNTKLNFRIINQAHRLGLGPGGEALRLHFGSVINYFKEVGFAGRNRLGQFDHFTTEDYISYIQKVAEETQGVTITKKLLWQRIRNGADDPSPNLIDKHFGGLNKLLEAANLPLHKSHVRWSVVDCLEGGLRLGKIPSAKEINSSPFLPSEVTIYKLFGSIPNYQKALAKKLQAAD